MKITSLLFIVSYLKQLVGALINLHFGEVFTTKILAAAKASFLLSPFAVLLYDMQIWFEGNTDYVNFVIFAIFADYFLGTYKHAFVDRDFSFKENIHGLLTKISLVVFVGILFEGMSAIVHHDSIVKEYLEIVARLMVFLYPAGSAMGNSSILSGGRFPPSGWMIKLNKFSENLNTKEFSNEPPQDDESQNL